MKLQEFIAEWNSPDTELLVHTSGSTGAPKPMWVEKHRMLDSARITCDFLGLKPGDTALLCLPLDYIAGKMMAVRSIERGLRLIEVEPSNHPLADLDCNIDFAAMVPSQVFCSLQVPQEREAMRRIRHLIIGGGAISSELQSAISQLSSEGLAPAIWSTYGMTETLSHIALRRLNGPDASEWYEPFDSVELSLDEDSCLVINAPLVHQDKLVTNDIAELDGRRFRILGRRDNIICSGGIKLQTEHIEERLRPFIRVPFCIGGKKDPKFGEVVALLLEDADGQLEDATLETAFAALDRYEIPKVIRRVKAIPMTATGKISRAEVRRMLCED
ncbi:MAG: AMP-binding protein [Bacteroidales bacterium]|nr:AMP-binding protein [Bacteroidales bacterium]